MASALDVHVAKIRSLSSEGNYRELAEALLEVSDQFDKNASQLDNVLDTLHNQQHSLGVLFVLVSKLSTMPAIPEDVEGVTRKVAQFVEDCDAEQIRFAVKTFSELCHLYTGYLTKHNLPPLQAIRVLSRAVVKLRKDPAQLTAVHADLFQVSLSAKMFSPALRLLEEDITSIACTDDAHTDARYFLLYYYYGGMIYTAQKQFDRALYCFEVAVATPAMAMSHIMLESYKKYVLVSLLLNGKFVHIPKYSSQVISRFIKPLSHAYLELATAYQATSSDDLRTATIKYRDVFARDNNLGLVKQLTASLYRKNIQRLTKTFVTLSLTDVAIRVQLSGPDEAEKHLLDMIKSGEIFATINQKDGMVMFKDDPRQYDTPDVMQRIQKEITRVIDLHQLITQKEEAIMLDATYVKKSLGGQLSDEDLAGASGMSVKAHPCDPAVD